GADVWQAVSSTVVASSAGTASFIAFMAIPSPRWMRSIPGGRRRSAAAKDVPAPSVATSCGGNATMAGLRGPAAGSAGEAVAQGQGAQGVAIDGRRGGGRVQRQYREGQVLPVRGGRACDGAERTVLVHDLLPGHQRRVAFEQHQPALGLAEEMRARDDLLARIAALLDAVGPQAFERELLRRPFLDLRLLESRQAVHEVEGRPACARFGVLDGFQSRSGPERARATFAAEVEREAV